MRIALCDDDLFALEQMKEQVVRQMKALQTSFEICSYTNMAAVLQTDMEFDIFLLDIQMPQITGIDFAKELRRRDRHSALIFITALKEYAIEAFEVEAVDYICKPVDEHRLRKALARAVQHVEQKKEKVLFVQTMHWRRYVKLNDLLYCEVINRKVYLHTRTEVIDYYCTLEDLKRQLDSRFFQCHRSYLLNLDYLQVYENDQIILENNERIPISRLRRHEFLKVMLQHLKKTGRKA